MGRRPIDAILPRLERVRSTGKGRWSARCPAHDDRGPSLSVREVPDGTLLIHDFAGCNSAAIVRAIGLELRDLFPNAADIEPGQRPKPRLDVKRALPSPPRRSRWFDCENFSDDSAWLMFVARACEERAWRCNAEPFEVRDAAKHSPAVAYAIVKEAARMFREFARSEDYV